LKKKCGVVVDKRRRPAKEKTDAKTLGGQLNQVGNLARGGDGTWKLSKSKEVAVGRKKRDTKAVIQKKAGGKGNRPSKPYTNTRQRGGSGLRG